MIRTMFGKVLFMVIAVLIISFTLTGLIMNYSLKKMVAEEKVEQLQLVAEKVINALDTVLRNENTRNPYLFISFIQTLANNTDCLIWIAGDDGTLVFYSEIPDYLKDKLEVSEEGQLKLPDSRQYQKQPVEYEIGDYFGLFADTGVDWVTINRHFTISNIPPYNMEANGVILIHSKVPNIYRLKTSIIIIFIISGFAACTIAIMFVALITKRITKPLKQMKNVARRVASGEFSERINVKGKDEIAEFSESFNNMIAALDNLERMRRDFIGNVSHELRTPLTTIKGFIEGILDGVIPDDKQESYLAIALDETRRMQHLVNDLLDLAKMQAGEVTLNMTDFDINELIRRCVISLQQIFIEKKLEITADFETERMFVHADSEAIQRVIINLLHNAVKFTPENGKIRVKTYTEKGKVYVSVEDNGKGIPKEELPYIFERFYKADKSRSEDRSGVGLGLAIVRNIIVAHNENIKVESDEGHGSVFTFSLRSSSISG